LRVVVTATETGAGKTWLTCRLLRSLRERGRGVAGRKPAQSYQPGVGATDAELIARAGAEPVHQVCPAERWFPLPMAPPMAAEVLGRPRFTIADLVAGIGLPEVDLLAVEGAGGLLSPLAWDGDNRSLVEAVRPEVVVLVAGAALGTINATRLCAESLRGWRLVVYMNRFDAGDRLHRANRDWLVDRDGLDVVVEVEDLIARLEGVEKGR
jgi:dethiobiotin synthetase